MNKLLSERIIDVFGQENLIYAQQERIQNIEVEDEIKSFLVSTGLPKEFNFMKFYMNLTSLSHDRYISGIFDDDNHMDCIYVFGLKLFNPFMIVNHVFENVGLNANPNIEDISAKIEESDLEDITRSDLVDELAYAHRVSIDTRNKNQVISIIPDEKRIIFINSSIQQFGLSIIACRECKSKKEFVSNMLEIDSRAMENEENWWSQIAFSIEEFFLNNNK